MNGLGLFSGFILVALAGGGLCAAIEEETPEFVLTLMGRAGIPGFERPLFLRSAKELPALRSGSYIHSNSTAPRPPPAAS